MYSAYSICQFYRLVACGNRDHIFLREALAPPSVAVGGGPFAATFSGIVWGMSRKIRGVSIVVLWRLTITRHGVFGSVDCWSEPSFPPLKASWRNPSLISESKIRIHVHESLCAGKQTITPEKYTWHVVHVVTCSLNVGYNMWGNYSVKTRGKISLRLIPCPQSLRNKIESVQLKTISAVILENCISYL